MKTNAFGASLLAALSLTGCALDESELSSDEAALEIGPANPTFEQTTSSIVSNAVGAAGSGTSRRYAGVSVAVIRDGVRTTHHFGEAVMGSGVRPTSNTLYAIGSLTKSVTGTLLARMDYENTVDLDDYLGPLVAPTWQLPADRYWITLEQLATMHSGLPASPPGGELGYREGSYTADMNKLMDSLEVCSTSNPCQEPKEVWEDGEYSNYGYSVLANVLARESGYTSVQSALSNKVLSPLGMTRTTNKANLTDGNCVIGTCTYSDYGDCDYTTSCNSTFSPYAAVGYHRNSSGIWVRESSPGSNDNIKAGSGVLWSNTTDMMKWLAYNMRLGTNVPAALTYALDRVHVVRTFDDMGLGWQQRELTYGDVWKKSGALPEEYKDAGNSFTAYIAFIEGSDEGVVVMANGPVSTGTIALDILEAIAD